MPVTCAVRSCKRNNIKSNERFFSFPAVRKNSTGINKLLISRRVAKWQIACGLKAVFTSSKICSRHFVFGHPAHLEEVESVDWVPSLFLIDSDEKADSPGASIEAESAHSHVDVSVGTEEPPESDDKEESSSDLVTDTDVGAILDDFIEGHSFENSDVSDLNLFQDLVRLADCWPDFAMTSEW